MSYTTTLVRSTSLLAVIACCCGFSWGLGKPDPCLEARSAIDTRATVSDPVNREKLDETILKACPNGAPGLFIRAERAGQTGRPDDTIRRYREVLAQDNTLAEAHGNLGLLLLDRGLEQEAAVELTRGLLGRSDPRYHRAIARIMAKGAYPALALFHYGEALGSFPNDAAIHAGLAEAYGRLGNYDKAAEEYSKLRLLHPDEGRYQLALADVYRKAGRLDQAIEVLRSYLREQASDKEGHRLLAEVQMEKGDRETARQEFLLAGVDVSINPDDFARKGDEFMKAREFGQAIGAYQTALNGRPAWQEIQYKLGKAQMSAGRDDDALATLSGLIKAGFKDGTAFYDLGLLRERGGQLDEATAAYRLAIIHQPGYVNAHRRLAEIFTWRGSFVEAADQYRELIRLRADNPLYHLNLGRVYERVRDLKKAMSEYEIAVRLDPDNLEGHRELAKIFVRMAQTTKAEQHYKEVLRLNNEDDAARNALITQYVKQKRYDELTSFIKSWLAKAPDDPQRHYRMGIVYEFKKEYDLAINEYKQAIERQSGNAKMLLALGRVYMKTGRLSESREILEAASSADPSLAEPQLLLSSIKSSPQHLSGGTRKKGKQTDKLQTVRKKMKIKKIGSRRK